MREDFENRKFTKAAENLYRLFVKAEALLAFNGPVMMLIIYGCIMAVSWFGAKFIVIGEMTTGEITSLFSYCLLYTSLGIKKRRLKAKQWMMRSGRLPKNSICLHLRIKDYTD